MCGIAGIVGRSRPPPDGKEAITRMVRALRHRGPDAFGLYRDDRAQLGHARLSIVDLATGDQPLCNEDERLWTVFNGELFNHLALRRELLALGHRFTTRCDTEVIVHAYEAWGLGAFERFNGQWALALWDARDERLVLSRDPFGIRPLYVCEAQGRVHFASEVKALFAADPLIPRAFDPLGLDQTFTFWSPLAPRTVFQGVEELVPGTSRVLDASGWRTHVHFRPCFPDRHQEPVRALPEAIERVRGALTRATQRQVQSSDVPVGAYLSGGLDSAITASLARPLAPLTTFSLRFDDPEFDETRYQRQMAAHLGTRHRERLVRPEELREVLPEVVRHAERPLLRTAAAPLFLLARHVRDEGFKVVLTGEGADELFAGYDLFREHRVRRFWARQPDSSLRPRLLERLYPYLARSPLSQRAFAQRFFGQGLSAPDAPGFSHGPRWRSTAALKRLFAPSLMSTLKDALHGVDCEAELLSGLPPDFARWDPLAQAQHLELTTLLGGYLLSAQGDRMLMASSVEGRFPFLDPEVVAAAASLAPSLKLRGLDEKHVLKRAFADLPEEILRRPKQPYRAPDARFLLAEPWPEWLRESTGQAALARAGVFDAAQVSRLFAKCLAAPAGAPLSNTDATALIAVVSTQWVDHALLHGAPALGPPLRTLRDLDHTQGARRQRSSLHEAKR